MMMNGKIGLKKLIETLVKLIGTIQRLGLLNGQRLKMKMVMVGMIAMHHFMRRTGKLIKIRTVEAHIM